MNKDEMVKIQQIEQMAIMDCQRVPRGTKCADCSFARPYSCNSYRMATALVNADYRKVGKGDILISKKAYYGALNAAQESGKRMGYAQGRDETAREILQEAYMYFNADNVLGLPNYLKNGRAARVVKGIAKSRGIELEG